MTTPPAFNGLARVDRDAATLLPCLITHAQDVKLFDDAHATDYLWGTHSSSWVSPWQATELSVGMLAGCAAQVTAQDVVLDLGCGDGRVLLLLSKEFSCEAIGWDCSEACIQMAEKLRNTSGIQKCKFQIVDFTKNPVKEELFRATILFAYLPVQALNQIRPLLEEAFEHNPDIKLVTNEYHFQDEENWELLANPSTIRVTRLKR